MKIKFSILLILFPIAVFASNSYSNRPVVNRNIKSKKIVKKRNILTKKEIDKRLETLENRRREIQLKIYKKRVELIKSDPELLELHKKAMAIHKALAIKINSNEQIDNLRRKAEKIDRDIVKLGELRDRLKK